MLPPQYGAPQMLQSMQPRSQREDGTLALTLAPTRELAVQIELVWSKVLHPFPWCVVGAVMGGEKKKSEKARLRKGVTALVATPGRLLDHLKTSQVDIHPLSMTRLG